MSSAEKIRIGFLPVAEATPLFVALRNEIFDHFGLRVELVPLDTGRAVITAALSSRVDGGISGVTPLLNAISKKKPIRIIADGGHISEESQPYMALMVGRRSRVRGVSDLKGKVVAINGYNTLSDMFLRLILSKAHMSESVAVVPLPFKEIIRSINRGKVDAGILEEPFLSQGMHSHGFRVVTHAEQHIEALQLSLVFFTEEYLCKNSEAVNRFLAAYSKAVKFIESDPGTAKSVMAEYLDIEKSVAPIVKLPAWDLEINVDKCVSETMKTIRTHNLDERGSVDVRNLTLVYRDGSTSLRALDDVSFSAKPGEFVCLLGPSGCGKTSILYVLAGFLAATGGRVLLDGRQIKGPGPERGVVFQKFVLFPWKSVRGNIELGLVSRGISPEERKRIVDYYIKAIGLNGFENMYPAKLSGGMEQRVGLARVLANDPLVILMDEPFGSLDARTRISMQELVLKIWHDFYRTIIFVTHDVDEAIFLGDRIVLLTASPGTVREEIEIDLPRPRSHEIMLSEEYLAYKRRIEHIMVENGKNMPGQEPPSLDP